MITPTIEGWGDLEKEIINCRKCPRLVAWREKVALEKKHAYRDWEYWGKGVPGFGDKTARVLVLGLAPGAHGSNRTGRMFTGDSSGDFLYPALYRAGFSNREYTKSREDDLKLNDLFITAVCRCAPPANKPAPQEIRNCRGFLKQEMTLLTRMEGIVALGQIAFHEALILLGERGVDNSGTVFGHGAFFEPEGNSPWLLASYHPSRQNTQTGRLTVEMFDRIWKRCRDLLNDTP
jgi:uracil-DNA glycosylase family 4